MTKTLKDYLIHGGVEDKLFTDKNMEENSKYFSIGGFYKGTYKILGLFSGDNNTFMNVVDLNGRQATLNLANQLNDQESTTKTQTNYNKDLEIIKEQFAGDLNEVNFSEEDLRLLKEHGDRIEASQKSNFVVSRGYRPGQKITWPVP